MYRAVWNKIVNRISDMQKLFGTNGALSYQRPYYNHSVTGGSIFSLNCDHAAVLTCLLPTSDPYYLKPALINHIYKCTTTDVSIYYYRSRNTSLEILT